MSARLGTKLGSYVLLLFLLLSFLTETLLFAAVQHPPSARAALQKARHGQAILHNKSLFHSSRKAAFRSAKRDLGISKTQRPDKVKRVPMTNRDGSPVLHNGRPIQTREYHFTRSDRSVVVITDHGFGHDFRDPKGKGNQGPHFNVRPLDPLTGNGQRTGKVHADAIEHYSW